MESKKNIAQKTTQKNEIYLSEEWNQLACSPARLVSTKKFSMYAFLKKDSGIFRFFTLLLLRKQAFTTTNSAKLCDTPWWWRFQRQNQRPMKIPRVFHEHL